jgi:hypothetical protein
VVRPVVALDGVDDLASDLSGVPAIPGGEQSAQPGGLRADVRSGHGGYHLGGGAERA